MKHDFSSIDECPICNAKLVDRGIRLDLARHAAVANGKAFDKDGGETKASRRDPQLLRHAERLHWSLNTKGTM